MALLERVRFRVSGAREHAIGTYRIVIGLLFLSHGLATLFGVLGGAKGEHGNAADFGAWPSWWAGLIQLVGGSLVVAGTGTRSAALIGSGSMAYAYFVVHQVRGGLPLQNGGETAALFCWSLVLLVFTGPGSWAAERLSSRTAQEPPGDTAQHRDSAATGRSPA